MSGINYRVHGMMQSYFTRKMTGYLDYKGIRWAFRRFTGTSPEAMAAGFPGGMPVVQTPDGEFMWDSTAMIHHLELRFPEPAVLPADPVQRFICYVLEDAADEWLYRPAVGTRWHFPENAAVGGFELARDVTVRMPLSADQAHAGVAAHVLSSCGPLGVSADTIQCWVDDVLRPWQRVVGEHLARRPYLFGERPSLADFALFGGNAAHFANDPLCRRWTDEDAPAVVQHTHRLLEPDDQAFGAWDDPARRRIRDVDRRARRAGAAVSPVGEPCMRRRRGRRRVRERGARRRARDRLPARRPRDAARPLRREPRARDSTTSSSGRESCPSSPTTSRSPVRFPTSASRRGQR